jgi:hypothetical protein
MPFVFGNRFDVRGLFEDGAEMSLEEMMEHYELAPTFKVLGDIKELIMKLERSGMPVKREPLEIKEEAYDVEEGQSCFKTIGWPFTIRSVELCYHLLPTKEHTLLTPFFINQNDMFSGMVYILAPEKFTSLILSKNKTRVGNRYVEIKQVGLQELEAAKLKYCLSAENIKKETFRGGMGMGVEKRVEEYGMLQRRMGEEYGQFRRVEEMSFVSSRRPDVMENGRRSELNSGRKPRKYRVERRRSISYS